MKLLAIRKELIVTQKRIPDESILLLKNSWETGIGSKHWMREQPLSTFTSFLKSLLGSRMGLSRRRFYPLSYAATLGRR